MKPVLTTFVLLATLCGHSRGLINKGRTLHLSHDDRWSIMNYHNELRRDVHAANMQHLIWDRQAARAARAWSRQCNFDRRRRDRYNDNLFYSTANIEEPANELLMDAMQKWAQGKDKFIPRQECGKTRRCEYLKIVTAAVESVGCAVTRCPVLKFGKSESETNANFIVCLYTPYVDISRIPPYRQGEPCTHCKQGYSCRHNLCSPPLLPFRNMTFGAEFDKQLRGSGKDVENIDTKIDTPPSIKTVSVHVSDNMADGGTKDQIKESVSEQRGQEEGRYTQERRRDQRQRPVSRRRDRNQEQIQRPSRRTKRQARYDPYAERRRQYERRRYLDRQRNERARRLRLRRERQRELERQQQQQRQRRPRVQPAYPRHITQQGRPRVQPAYPRRITQPDTISTMEQTYFLQIHNTMRNDGLPKLEWSRKLERWAKYVIRCDIEYPGPINCYTNFGKVPFNAPVYNAVYDWNAEGNDTFKKLKTGCRTPYDRSLCNHNTIMMNRSIREMACATRNCGTNRNIVCIYK